jgi:hypothetical protein
VRKTAKKEPTGPLQAPSAQERDFKGGGGKTPQFKRARIFAALQHFLFSPGLASSSGICFIDTPHQLIVLLRCRNLI